MAEIKKKEEILTPEEQAKQQRQAELRENAKRVAVQILGLTRNGLFVSLRFMDVALTQFEYLASSDIRNIATSGMHLVYDPKYVIEAYMKDKAALSRDYLHMVMHCVFRHPFVSTNLNREYWDLAADIAVEGVICDMDIRQVRTREAAAIEEEIGKIRERIRTMTAEHIYGYLKGGDASQRDIERWKRLFTRDDHSIWWDIAKEIEEEMKRRAEEAEKEERRKQEEEESKGRKGDDDYEDEETDEEPQDQDASDDAEGSDTDEDGSGEGEDSEDEGDQEGEGADDGDDGEEGEDADDEGSGDDDEDSEADEAPDEKEEEDEDYEPDEDPSEDEYTDEWTQEPGDGENQDAGSDEGEGESGEQGEESSGENGGGGDPGEDPEQSEDEGSDRDNDTSTDGMEGSGENGQQEDEPPDNDMDGSPSDKDHRDQEMNDDPYGDQEQRRSDPSGSSMEKRGTNRGGGGEQHSSGTAGAGDGSQAAWEDSEGDTRNEDGGEKDPENRRETDGKSDPNSDLEDAGNSQKEMAEAEQGSFENTPDDREDEDPSFMHNGDVRKELEDKWKDISERMLVDLETSSKEWGDKSDSMVLGLKKVNRDKYDYRTFLQKFATLKEDMQINDDEFDYIYYTYGMNRYGNIPLIEPLEYKEVKKVRDFVIAIDTSGSCAGEVVQKFLDKTYSIFAQQENFFRKINLHIIQCDAQIQSDVKITNKTEFDNYIRDMKFTGFGGTDFRPVFQYVNEMLDAHEFDDLKGMIYFTDGNGTYPKKRPPYETAFVFVDDDEFDYQVPSWAMKLVLETTEITDEIEI